MLHTWSIIFTLTAVKELIQEHLTNKRPRSSIWQSKRLLIVRLKVRVLPGSPKRTHPEPPSIPVEQFLAMLRFEQRDKLAELPGDLLETGRDCFD